MSDFERLYGEPLLISDQVDIAYENIVTALSEVSLEVKPKEILIMVDSTGQILQKGDDQNFHLSPKMEYVIMRSMFK